MVRVGIVFENGVKVAFEAEEFDVDVRSMNPAVLRKFEYKDADGNMTPLYLTPANVSGITVTPLGASLKIY